MSSAYQRGEMTVTCPSKPEAASVGTEITVAKSDWKQECRLSVLF